MLFNILEFYVSTPNESFSNYCFKKEGKQNHLI